MAKKNKNKNRGRKEARKARKTEQPKQVVIKAGRLRERVKAGELSAQEVLDWVLKQPQLNPHFVGWLERRISSGTPQDS